MPRRHSRTLRNFLNAYGAELAAFTPQLADSLVPAILVDDVRLAQPPVNVPPIILIQSNIPAAAGEYGGLRFTPRGNGAYLLGFNSPSQTTNWRLATHTTVGVPVITFSAAPDEFEVFGINADTAEGEGQLENITAIAARIGAAPSGIQMGSTAGGIDFHLNLQQLITAARGVYIPPDTIVDFFFTTANSAVDAMASFMIIPTAP